jgi:hypothetical protein
MRRRSGTSRRIARFTEREDTLPPKFQKSALRRSPTGEENLENLPRARRVMKETEIGKVTGKGKNIDPARTTAMRMRIEIATSTGQP